MDEKLLASGGGGAGSQRTGHLGDEDPATTRHAEGSHLRLAAFEQRGDLRESTRLGRVGCRDTVAIADGLAGS